MKKKTLLFCPELNQQTNIRIEELKNTVAEWIHSEAFTNLVRLFDGADPKTESLKEQIEYYNSFVDVWDYRKKKANGGERWLIKEDAFLKEHKQEIMKSMALLGLTDIVDPVAEPDYILPLGGAKMSNLDRCLEAADVCRQYPNSDIPVIALTGMRPISDAERSCIDLYAPDAVTEYDAICAGMTRAFHLENEPFLEETHSDENVNLSWAVRHYNNTSRTIDILSAPSSDPARRANSMDTFEFFLGKYSLKRGSKILLVTSCIYVPFQLMKFTDLALSKGFYVDCIGNKDYSNASSYLNTASFLQELKAAVNAIYSLSVKYF